MNRRSPTRFSAKASSSAANQVVTCKIQLVTTSGADRRATISGSGCFPAAASTRHDKRSSLTVSHGRVPFDGCRTFVYRVGTRSIGVVTSGCAIAQPCLLTPASRTADQLARRPAHRYVDHEQRFHTNDVLTRSVDALTTRAGVRLNQALYRARVFCESCITSLQSPLQVFIAKLVSLILKTKVLTGFVSPLNYRAFSFARATQNGDNHAIWQYVLFLINTALTVFMVAFHWKRSFPARKSAISPGGAYRAVFLSPISAPTAFPLVRGASACSSFPARQASSASRAFFLPQAITRSLLNAHRSTPAAPTHTRNTQ